MIQYDKSTDALVVGMDPVHVLAGEYALVVAIVRPDGTTTRVDAEIGQTLLDPTGVDFQQRFMVPALHAIKARVSKHR